MSGSLGFARWHMQTMQTSEFLHLLGHSSGSAVSWDVFPRKWNRTIISGILLWGSLAGWVGVTLCLCLSSCLLSSICQASHLRFVHCLISHISNIHRTFVISFWTLQSFFSSVYGVLEERNWSKSVAFN